MIEQSIMSLDNEFPQSRLLKLLIEILSLQITKYSEVDFDCTTNCLKMEMHSLNTTDVSFSLAHLQWNTNQVLIELR